jgi:hypothetical protein
METHVTVLARSAAGTSCRLEAAFRAVVLAVVVSLLMAFPWTYREASSLSGGSGAAPAASMTVVDGVDADGSGTSYAARKPLLDFFSLPRGLSVETSRQSSEDPSRPVSGPASPVRPGADAAWVALVDIGRSYTAPPSQSDAWASLKTPAGPPAG